MFFHGLYFGSKSDKRLVLWFQKKGVNSNLSHKNLNPLIFTLQTKYPHNIVRVLKSYPSTFVNINSSMVKTNFLIQLTMIKKKHYYE